MFGGSLLTFLNDLRAQAVAILDANGNQLSGFDSSRPATAAETSVPSAIADTVLLVANPARRRVIIHNNSIKTLWVQFGAAAAVNKGFPIGANQAYHGPLNDFTGAIHGVWSAVNGTAEVTEITT